MSKLWWNLAWGSMAASWLTISIIALNLGVSWKEPGIVFCCILILLVLPNHKDFQGLWRDQ